MLVNGDWRHPQKVLFAVPAVSENRTQGLRQAQGGGHKPAPHLHHQRHRGGQVQGANQRRVPNASEDGSWSHKEAAGWDQEAGCR